MEEELQFRGLIPMIDRSEAEQDANAPSGPLLMRTDALEKG
jgi:hypothetical protein